MRLVRAGVRSTVAVGAEELQRSVSAAGARWEPLGTDSDAPSRSSVRLDLDC